MYANLSVFRQAFGLAGETQRFKVPSDVWLRMETALQDCDMRKFNSAIGYLKDHCDFKASAGDMFTSKNHAMKSAAGWYVGQSCCELIPFEALGEDEAAWVFQPYDRISEYVATKYLAEAWVRDESKMMPRIYWS